MAGAEWSDKRIGTLTRMAADHHTAAEVAVQLGISRSAVLGKANRLGIVFRGRQPAAVPAETAAPPKPQASRPEPREFPKPGRRDGSEPCGECYLKQDEICDICGAAHATSPSARPGRDDRAPAIDKGGPAAEPPARQPEQPAAPVPAPQVHAGVIQPTPPGWPKPAGPHAVSLLDLRDHHCRMPLFGPLQRTGLFCGEPVEQPGGSWCAGCRPLIREGRPALRGEAAEAMRARFTRQSSSGAFA
ncbi:MAG: hypothetical protein GY873_30250 [Bosea sp.]|uniref:GcrA family cell cycle regulator n=1 Tax=Bosea sp. (in: a-proteobacteria) TaxID=1871050 RepID=UPI00239E156E|nr:hypothetical protein [Bosea sp. (in: a-proteobacteria)]MCP4738478.1 hypothetical protein [Bosea sp. (in: a-proteobacteria)]